VARGTELAVLPGACDFAEHILIHVALGIAVFHRDFVKHLDGLSEQGRVAKSEPGIAHMTAVARSFLS
jgi:hypothetical protein